MSLRLLGIVGMIGGPMLLIENALSGFGARPAVGPLALFGALYMVGWLCSSIGLWRLAATGAGLVGRAILGLLMLGLVLAALNNLILVFVAAPDRDAPLFVVTDLAWPLSHVYMLVVGIAAVVERRLAGWRRWAPLVAGLTIPLTLIAQTIVGALGLQVPEEAFAIIPAIALPLLGYAVFTGGGPTVQERTGGATQAAH